MTVNSHTSLETLQALVANAGLSRVIAVALSEELLLIQRDEYLARRQLAFPRRIRVNFVDP